MERINVVDFEEKSDISKKTKKAYTYLEIKTDDNQTYRIFGDNAKVVEEGGVGFYDADFIPSPTNPKYSILNTIKALGGPPSQAKTAQAPTDIREKLKPHEPSTNDSILLQVCLKVAGEVLAGSGVEAKAVSAYADSLFTAAQVSLNPKMEEVGF